MSPKSVSVLDQSGSLLTSGESNASAGLDAEQLRYVNQIESGYAKRIFELLEPIVGRDNLRASVTADVDFTQSEATSEAFKPNQGADATVAIKSQATSEQQGSAAATPTGVPGAASNQPPLAATAPLTGASQPLQAAQAGAGAGNTRREASTMYEVDKTVRVTRSASGNIKRLNAAVVVNHRSVTDAKGKTTSVALSPEEIEKLTALVRESIGFSQDRGDSVKVINAPFKIETLTRTELPLWKQPEVLDMLRAAAVPGALMLVAALVFFGIIRPAMNVALAPPPKPASGSALNAVVDDQQQLSDLPALPAPKRNDHLDNARTLAKENPAAVASILRSWVSGDVA